VAGVWLIDALLSRLPTIAPGIGIRRVSAERGVDVDSSVPLV